MALGAVASSLSKGAIGAAKKIGVSGTFEALTFGNDVNQRMKRGDSMTSAITKEAVNTALWMTAPGVMAATMAAQVIPAGIQGAYRFRRQRHEAITGESNHATSGVVGGNFQDSEHAATMRQAAVQQIQGNKLNARSALGGEARIFAQRYY